MSPQHRPAHKLRNLIVGVALASIGGALLASALSVSVLPFLLAGIATGAAGAVLYNGIREASAQAQPSHHHQPAVAAIAEEGPELQPDSPDPARNKARGAHVDRLRAQATTPARAAR